MSYPFNLVKKSDKLRIVVRLLFLQGFDTLGHHLFNLGELLVRLVKPLNTGIEGDGRHAWLLMPT